MVNLAVVVIVHLLCLALKVIVVVQDIVVDQV